MAQADVKGIVEAYQLNKKSENKKQLQSISMQQSEINIQMNLNSSYFMPLTYTQVMYQIKLYIGIHQILLLQQ